MFKTWAWQYVDINKELAWLSKVEEPESSSADDTDNNFGAGTGTESGSSNGAATESSTGNGVAVEFGIDNANDISNGEDTNMKNVADSIVNAEFAINDDTRINEVMNQLILNDKSILFKRQVFKTFQFLIEKKSRLHVWKSTQLCDDLKFKNIFFVQKSTKEFIT